MPSHPAESHATEHLAAVPQPEQALHQGSCPGGARLAAIPHGTLHRVRNDDLRGRDRALDGHEPAVLGCGRRDRARGAARHGARLHVAGGHGRRHGIRHARRTARDDGGLSRRAGAPHRDLRRVADLLEHRVTDDRRAARDGIVRALPEPRVHGRGVCPRAARRERTVARRQSGHAPRAHDDSRSDAARILGAPPRAHGVVGRTEALQLCVHRYGAVRALGGGHDGDAERLRTTGRGADSRAQAPRERRRTRSGGDRVREATRVPRAGTARAGISVGGARHARPPGARRGSPWARCR